jgi:hypothetical protein
VNHVITFTKNKMAAGAVATMLLAGACGSDSDSSTTQAANAVVATTAAANASSAPSGDSQTEAEPAPATSTAETAAPASPQPSGETRDAVLRLAGTTLDGSQFDTEAYVGKDLLLWFWAPW